MDITGYDSVIFTCTFNASAVKQFVDILKEQWPNLIMDIEKLDIEKTIQGVKTTADCLTAMAGGHHVIIYFYRDEEMRRLFNDRGWVLDLRDEGPFSIHFRWRRKVLFELADVTERASDENSVGSIDPYPAIICSPQLVEITLVSPDDPATNSFSQRILSLVLSAVLES